MPNFFINTFLREVIWMRSWQFSKQIFVRHNNILACLTCNSCINSYSDLCSVQHVFLLLFSPTHKSLFMPLRSSWTTRPFRKEHYNQRRSWSTWGPRPTWIKRPTRISRTSRLTRYQYGSYLFEETHLLFFYLFRAYLPPNRSLHNQQNSRLPYVPI